MRALRQRRGQHPGCRPRGRPARHPIPRELGRASLRLLASANRQRADGAEQANADLHRRLDEQARELAEARARIAELERLLAEARGESGEDEPGEARSGRSDGDGSAPEDRPGGSSGGPGTRPRPASPRPGIMEVRRQLSQALEANAELRALVEELQRRIATLERRCTEMEQQLQRALSLAEGREPPASGHVWDAASATSVQERAAIFGTEAEQIRRERAEIVEQRDRLSAMLTSLTLRTGDIATGLSTDYSMGRTELFSQIRAELEERDRFAQWEAEHRDRETDRRLDPTRTIDEQALIATITVRWQLMDHAPQGFRGRPRWAVEGVLLDPSSEQFLIRQSRERVAYRHRVIAQAAARVTRSQQ